VCLASTCEPASNLAFKELTEEYKGRFYSSDQNLVVVVENVPGITIAAIESHVADGHVVLEATRISSGSGGEHVFCVDLSKYHLDPDWPEHIMWAEPNADLVPVAPVSTGETARRLANGCG
jgi:hypothetical protein